MKLENIYIYLKSEEVYCELWKSRGYLYKFIVSFDLGTCGSFIKGYSCLHISQQTRMRADLENELAGRKTKGL